MYLTKKHLPRRTMLKGLGATIALPFLDAMQPAATAVANADTRRLRFVAIEMVHGAAGSTPFGMKKNMWSPAAEGSEFDLSPTSLAPLEAYRDYLTIVSNTDVHNAEAFAPPEIGGDHFRSAAVFLTQSHPHQTQGSDIHAGISVDQIYAKKAGQDTPIPSMQSCLENVDQAGGCFYGYSCAYTDSISWASPTEPLPVIRDPRVVFDDRVPRVEGRGCQAGELHRTDDRGHGQLSGAARPAVPGDDQAARRTRREEHHKCVSC